MPRTTHAAFNEFERRIHLTQGQQNLITLRAATIQRNLRRSFPPSSSMPFVSSRLIGSAGRSTMIRPPDDVDVLALFSGRRIGLFDNLFSNSRAFLYGVRDALAEHHPVEVVGARGQAVRLFHTQLPYFDVAPVFVHESGGFGLPDGHGRWLRTDPLLHARYMAQRNRDLGLRLKPLVRKLKCWNRAHSLRLKSFHVEVMVASMFSSMTANSRRMAHLFFESAPSYLHCNDPAGYGGDLALHLTWNQGRAVVQGFDAAAERAERALVAEGQGDHREAIRLWRVIFGSAFPAYG